MFRRIKPAVPIIASTLTFTLTFGCASVPALAPELTPVEVATPTIIATVVATPTKVTMPTSTPTRTPKPTDTPTFTPSPTNTQTFTPIPIPTPTPTPVPPTPKPRCECNPKSMVIFYPSDMGHNVTKRVESLRQACAGADINAYIIDHPDKVSSLSIQGVTDVVIIGHRSQLETYNLGRLSDLTPRATFYDTCYASKFGNLTNANLVFYSSVDKRGTGSALVNHLVKVINGERYGDLDGNGLIYASEILSSYKERPVILEDGRETTIGDSDNPGISGPDICLLCPP